MSLVTDSASRVRSIDCVWLCVRFTQLALCSACFCSVRPASVLFAHWLDTAAAALRCASLTRTVARAEATNTLRAFHFIWEPCRPQGQLTGTSVMSFLLPSFNLVRERCHVSRPRPAHAKKAHKNSASFENCKSQRFHSTTGHRRGHFAWTALNWMAARERVRWYLIGETAVCMCLSFAQLA